MSINNHHVYSVLRLVYSREKALDVTYVTDLVLRISKDKRRIISHDVWNHEGVDIFKRKEVTVRGLLTHLLNEDYIKIHDDMMTITDLGRGKYERILTNSHSEEYVEYEKKLYSKFDELRYKRPNVSEIQHYFYNKLSLAEVIDMDIRINSYPMATKRYHEGLLKELGFPAETLDDYYILHLYPKIFLPYWENKYEESQVELRISGIKNPLNLCYSRPFPNRRYVVAGLMMGREEMNFGFYVMIPKTKCPNELELRYEWIVHAEGQCYTMTHDLTLSLVKRDSYNVFSTNRAGSNLNTTLSTIVPNGESECSDKRPFKMKSVSNGYQMIERAILTSFPLDELKIPLESKLVKKHRKDIIMEERERYAESL